MALSVSNIHKTVHKPAKSEIRISDQIQPDIFIESMTKTFWETNMVLYSPFLVFDSQEVKVWRGKKVVVSYDGTTIFAGFITDITRSLSNQENGVVLSCKSFLHFADKTFIGAHYQRQAVRYPKGKWRMGDILRDIFFSSAESQIAIKGGGGQLENDWRNNITLGVTHDLPQSFIETDIVFRQTNLREALEQILTLVPDIVIQETFNSAGKSVLNFRNVNTTKVHDFIVGSNIQSTSETQTFSESVNRVILWGEGVASTMSFSTNAANALFRLEKGWDVSSEGIILKDPSKTAQPQYQHVFRRYLFPEWLSRGLRNNTLTMVDVDSLGLSKHGFIYSGPWLEVIDDPLIIGFMDTNLSLLQPREVPVTVDNFSVMFQEPCINIKNATIGYSSNANTLAYILNYAHEPAIVGFTATIMDNDKPFRVVVSKDKEELEDVDYLTLQVQNESFGQHLILSNTILPAPPESSGTPTFVTSTIEVKNDWQEATDFATNILNQQPSSFRKDVEITYPLLGVSIQPADRVRIPNDKNQDEELFIVSLSLDFRTLQSTIAATNEKPLIVSETIV